MQAQPSSRCRSATESVAAEGRQDVSPPASITWGEWCAIWSRSTNRLPLETHPDLAVLEVLLLQTARWLGACRSRTAPSKASPRCAAATG